MTSDKASFDLGRMRIGTIYANALLDCASDAGNTEGVLYDFQALFDDVISPREDMREAIMGSILSEEQRIDVLNKAFGGQMDGTLLTFLKVVTQHGRQDCLREIFAAAKRIHNQRSRRIEVTAKTASAMPDDLADSLAEQLREKLGQEVVLLREIDPSIIGGLVVRVGDTVIDGSVANRLRQLRQKALETTAREARASLGRFTSSQQS